MHFLRLDRPLGSTGLPPNAVQYEFAENVEVSDPVVFTLGREIIFRLCDPRQTLIKFTFEPEFPKYLRRKIAMRPVEIVSQFLCSLVLKRWTSRKWKKSLRTYVMPTTSG